MWRVTGARRFWRILTFRARWGGSRAYSQYDWTLARFLLLRLWLVVRRWGGRSSSSKSSYVGCRTTGFAMGCCAIGTCRRAPSLRVLPRRRPASAIEGALGADGGRTG